MTYCLCLTLFMVGVFCILRKRSLIKIIIGIGIMEYSVNLFFVLAGYRSGGRAPIFASDQVIQPMVDPLPQAFVSVSIVIGLAMTILLTTLAIRLFDKYKTFDITKINGQKG